MMSSTVLIICIVIFVLVIITFQYFLVKRIIDKKFNNFQTSLMDKYYEDVDSIYKKMRGWRHDYHNHIQVMKAYLELGNYDEIDEYLNALSDDITNVDTVIKTGSLMTDAILNTKMSIANSNDINLNVKAIIPKKIPLTDLELCVIIGNLFDNAIDGCMTLENATDRFIRVYIDKLNDNFYISITNSCLGKRKRTLGKFLTTKFGKDHGFGSERINAIVKKYSAYINRQSEDKVFSVELMLPL